MYKLKCLSNHPTHNILAELDTLPAQDNLSFSMAAKFFCHRRHAARLMILAKIPKNVKSLDLSVNGLGSLTLTGDLYRIDDRQLFADHGVASLVETPLIEDCLKTLPLVVRERVYLLSRLDLLAIFEGRRMVPSLFADDLLGDLLSIIPSTVETLDLSGNFLFLRMSCKQLVTALNRLPKGIITLDLGYNGLEYKTVEDLYKIFHAIPLHVTRLSIKGSCLFKYSLPIIIELLKCLPSHIKFIDLSENGLEEYSVVDLYQLISVVPVDRSVAIGYRDKDGRPMPIILQGKMPLSLSEDSARRIIEHHRLRRLSTSLGGIRLFTPVDSIQDPGPKDSTPHSKENKKRIPTGEVSKFF